jgi:ABC-2 type transport system ATP-binding protein
MNAVEIRGLEKSFTKGFLRKERKKVLGPVDLEIREGEIFGLLGPNGAGKTTLISILTGLLIPEKGSVRVFGRDVLKETHEAKRMMGMWGPSGSHEVSVKEILEFFGRTYDIDEKELKKRVEESLKTVGMWESRDVQGNQLSTGMKQRAGLAKILLTMPKLMLLDEPTLGLDVDIALKIRKIIKKLPGKGVTIILTTHYMTEADLLCDRIALIDRGRIVKLDTPQNLKKLVSREDIIRIRFSKLNGNPERILKDCRGVSSVKFIRNCADVFVDNAEKRMHAILDRLLEKGFVIKSVETQKPTLEDVFFKLTGGELE